MARKRVLVLMTLLTACAGIAAQEPKVAFEVGSVRRGHDRVITGGDFTAGVGMPRVLPGGRFEANQVTAEQLLWFAYTGRLKQEYQFAGVPAWMHTERFVISAKAPNDASIDQMRPMVQSLLEDRFKMVTHMEGRQMQLQALVPARTDGTLGPRLFRMDTCSPQVLRELIKKFPEKYRSPPEIPIGTGTGTSGCSDEGLNSLAATLQTDLECRSATARGSSGLTTTCFQKGCHHKVRHSVAR